MMFRFTVSLTVLVVLVCVGPMNGAEQIYWTNRTGTIERSNIDGTEKETLLAGLDIPDGIAVDPIARKLYWVDRGADAIQRSNLDGSDVELVSDTYGKANKIALDVVHQQVYWTTNVQSGIHRTNFDGTGHIQVVSNAHVRSARGIAVDPLGGKIYWTDIDAPLRVARANLDGTNVETIIPLDGGRVANALALDLVRGKVYIGHNNPIAGAGQQLARSNLDGSDFENLALLILPGVDDFAIDESSETLYWAGIGHGKIGSINLDGSGFVTIHSGLDRPGGIAFGPIPEPSTFILLTMGAVGLLAYSWRRKRKAA